MRALLVLLLVAATRAASAEPPRAATCDLASARVAQLVTTGDRTTIKLVGQRCDKDRWSVEARSCFAQATTERAAATCLDRLSKDQQRALAGDADRAANRRVGQWMTRRPATAFVLPVRSPLFSLAVQTDAPDITKARALHAEGMSAYRAGRFEVAVRKFEAANVEDPSPELLYHLAQAYRLKGDHRAALELYQKYVDLAPNGAAAADSRRQIEVLIDELP